ncbi:hypothetical protein D5272_01380 [bacterium D16-76]|nr:hypothetical protein [bacterium D16-76]
MIQMMIIFPMQFVLDIMLLMQLKFIRHVIIVNRRTKMNTKTACENDVEIELDFGEIANLLDRTLPDPSLLEYYRMRTKREIMWNADIEDDILEVSLAIRKWNVEDNGIEVDKRVPIKIFINSDGGSVDAVMNVIDLIKLSKTPVITIGMGKVYSAGGLLLMAGHKRYIFKHTSCLIHDGSSGAVGSIGKLIDNLKFTEKLEALIKEYIISSTKITEQMFDANYRRDWFMFSDEMLELGVADEIIDDIDTIL